MNNLTVNSVMDEEYDCFFGFTCSEVHEMMKYYGVTEKETELKDWYDGYCFGSEEIYNPWSVINYISKVCIPQAYWVNTGKNEVLEDVLKVVAADDITERLYALLQGKRVIARINQNVADGAYLCEVSIPNKEIASVYKGLRKGYCRTFFSEIWDEELAVPFGYF